MEGHLLLLQAAQVSLATAAVPYWPVDATSALDNQSAVATEAVGGSHWTSDASSALSSQSAGVGAAEAASHWPTSSAPLGQSAALNKLDVSTLERVTPLTFRAMVGFRVRGPEFRVQGLRGKGRRVKVLELRVKGLGSRV